MAASKLLGVVLLLAGAGLLTVGLLGWRRRLPRNRFAGIRTPATLRSEAAFTAANHVAAPPVLAAGAVCVAGGALAWCTDGGPALAVIVGVTGAGALGLLLAGGLLGHRVAAAMPPPGCRDCTCSGGPAPRCDATPFGLGARGISRRGTGRTARGRAAPTGRW